MASDDCSLMKFNSAARGFHVYKDKWIPKCGEALEVSRFVITFGGFGLLIKYDT